jgi:hypothetical protein
MRLFIGRQIWTGIDGFYRDGRWESGPLTKIGVEGYEFTFRSHSIILKAHTTRRSFL